MVIDQACEVFAKCVLPFEMVGYTALGPPRMDGVRSVVNEQALGQGQGSPKLSNGALAQGNLVLGALFARGDDQIDSPVELILGHHDSREYFWIDGDDGLRRGPLVNQCHRL